MSTTRPWIAWYPADIFNDPKYICMDRSAKLTYRELLDRAWLTEAKLPDNERKLAALAGLTLEEFRADWGQIQDPDDPCFITHPDSPGFLTNKRLLAEWRKADEQAEIARANGKKGGRPPKKDKAKQHRNTTKKTKPVSSGLAKQNPTPNPEKSYPQSQSHIQSQEKKKEDGPAQLEIDPGPPPIITIPVNDGTEFPITEADVEEWRNLYGRIDVVQTLKNIRGYWGALPKNKRKTPRGIKKSIATWMAKENDRAPVGEVRKENPYAEFNGK